jgi:hypothetical protein
MWKATGASGLLKSFDAFYLSQWVNGLQRAKEDFEEELEDTLLNATDQDEIKYLTYVVTKLMALAEPLARLPTAAPTSLMPAVKAERPFKHTSFFRQVTKALAVPGKSTATPPYDDEEVARPFQNEYAQDNFLAVYLRVNGELQKRIISSKPEPTLSADLPPLILKVDMVDLLDLLEIMQERGDWKLRDKASRKLLCQRITTLFELPPSKKESKSPDWQRLFYLLGEREKNKSKTLTNQSKKGLYDAIKPPEST